MLRQASDKGEELKDGLGIENWKDYENIFLLFVHLSDGVSLIQLI